MKSLRAYLFRHRGVIVAVVAMGVLWGASPTSSSLCLGLTLALAGESVRLWAIGYAGQHTRGQKLAAPVLVTSGPYAIVRNPLYLGNLINAIAVVVASLGGYSPGTRLFGLVATSFFMLLLYGQIVRAEEEFLEQRFGPSYRTYRENTPALWPNRNFFQQLKRGGGTEFLWTRALNFERMTLLWQGLIWSYLYISTS